MYIESTKPQMPKSKRERCFHCKSKKLILVTCQTCDKKFCITHIHDFVHSCPRTKQSKTRRTELVKIEPSKLNKI